MSAKKLSFEDAVKKLEESANKLKSGKLSLEDSVKVYEESVKYYETCKEILDKAFQKIEIFNPETNKAEDFEN